MGSFAEIQPRSSPPETSIVIPTHGGRFLRATVESVIAQSHPDWELIIVDDGSTDGTADVARALAAQDRRIRVVSQSNSGIARARNRGLVEISPGSTFVAVIDHDDLWLPDTLATFRRLLRDQPTAVAAHGMARSIDERDVEIPCTGQEGYLPWNRRAVTGGRVEMWPIERPTEFRVLAFEDCIVGTGSALIRRSALDRVGAFDWRAEPADDYDLWVRLSRLGPIVYLNTVVMSYREHGDNRSLAPPPPRGRGSGYVRHKIITSPENTAEQRRIAIEGFRAHARMLLAARWAKLCSSWRARDYGTLPRQAVTALFRVAAYARGRPWRWQRGG
jgi:glycosyltransferase involved in cell wall biosynthesis